MSYNYLGLVNNINRSLNEVELTSADFNNAVGWYSHAKDAVNFAIQRINDEPVEWPFYNVSVTLPLTVEQVRYPYPNDCKRVDFNSFRLKASSTLGVEAQSLFQIDYEEFLQRYSGMEDEPENYANVPELVFKGNNFSFGILPPPSDEFEIVYEYYRVPPDLSDADDVPAIPYQFRSVLQKGMMHYAYMFRGDDEKAGSMLAQFEDGIKDMRITLVNNRTDYVRSTYIPR